MAYHVHSQAPVPPSNLTTTVSRRLPSLPRLFVYRVLVAEPAEFLVLYPPRMFFLVLGGRVVSAFAVCTLKRDDLSHRWASGVLYIFNDLELATGIEPVTSSLPRKCSTN